MDEFIRKTFMYVIQSLIAGSAVFAVSELRAMKESLEQLNQKMPVIIMQSSESRKLIDENKMRINDLDDKVFTIEKNQVLIKAQLKGGLEWTKKSKKL